MFSEKTVTLKSCWNGLLKTAIFNWRHRRVNVRDSICVVQVSYAIHEAAMSRVSLGAQFAHLTADERNEYYKAQINGNKRKSAPEPPQKRAKRTLMTGNIQS